ncbi:hypothetical protein GY45DRAFT_1432784 [Cubamyces sp. BRFM 1775]|nr:hypothetical protein GY45DRAFT_1432784 [Cubamyces sp. BRFM 1775]
MQPSEGKKTIAPSLPRYVHEHIEDGVTMTDREILEQCVENEEKEKVYIAVKYLDEGATLDSRAETKTHWVVTWSVTRMQPKDRLGTVEYEAINGYRVLETLIPRGSVIPDFQYRESFKPSVSGSVRGWIPHPIGSLDRVARECLIAYADSFGEPFRLGNAEGKNCITWVKEMLHCFYRDHGSEFKLDVAQLEEGIKMAEKSCMSC